MDSGYVVNPLVFLIGSLLSLYLVIVMLRVMLQVTRADFYNPLSQFIVKATQPVLKPLQTVLPTVSRIDLAAVTLMLVLQTIVGVVQHPGQPPIFAILVWSIAQLIALMINILLFCIFVVVLLSWFNPGTYNPAVSLLHSLTRPILEPIQRRMPPLGGLDLSPVVALLGLQVLKMLLIPPLYALINSGI